jgi:hypothetical protein
MVWVEYANVLPAERCRNLIASATSHEPRAAPGGGGGGGGPRSSRSRGRRTCAGYGPLPSAPLRATRARRPLPAPRRGLLQHPARPHERATHCVKHGGEREGRWAAPGGWVARTVAALVDPRLGEELGDVLLLLLLPLFRLLLRAGRGAEEARPGRGQAAAARVRLCLCLCDLVACAD